MVWPEAVGGEMAPARGSMAFTTSGSLGRKLLGVADVGRDERIPRVSGTGSRHAVVVWTVLSGAADPEVQPGARDALGRRGCRTR